MKKIILACLLFLGTSVFADAATLHRWPIDYYASPTYSRWFDHDSRAGYSIRYDGADNPGGDGHTGTDILGNGSTTYVRTGAVGTLYYAIIDCPNNGYIGSTCGGGYGNHSRVQHSDGKVTIYAHMQSYYPGHSGSVYCGEAIGIMGTSGSSSGVHLHLEMWSDIYATQRIDHFGGAYSNGGFSYWTNQNGGGTGKPGVQCQ